MKFSVDFCENNKNYMKNKSTFIQEYTCFSPLHNGYKSGKVSMVSFQTW